MNIVIADDHALFRHGIRQLMAREFPDASVIEASSLDEMMELVPLHPEPNLMILDLNMPGVHGVDCVTAMVELFPHAKIVIMSASENRREVGAALAAGIDGYIPKSLDAGEIAGALKKVMDGSTYVPLSITRRAVLGDASNAEAPMRIGELNLTERQRHVLEQLMLGKSSKEIGRVLDITENTVKIHLAALYRVLGVKSRFEAIAKVSGPTFGRA